jgi:hypothetical protein
MEWIKSAFMHWCSAITKGRAGGMASNWISYNKEREPQDNGGKM